MRDFRRLTVLRKADLLLDCVYRISAALPTDERFVLATQMRKAALSIGSNIAEGAGRSSDAEFERFLDIAAGSASELQYQLTVAERLGIPSPVVAEADRLAHEVKRMLHRLIEASRRRRTG